MFELFGGGVTAEHVNQSNQVHAINHLTIMLVLVEKGLVTAEEVEAARTRATQFVDQEWARKREESEKKFDEQYPNIRKMFGQVLGGQ